MRFKTNYELIKSIDPNEKKSVILTTWLLWAIDRSKSLKWVVEYFKKESYNILLFDMFAHWWSEWKIENFTLSLVYKQVLEMIELLEEKWKNVEVLYWVSASSLPILKAGLDKKIDSVILRSPAIEMYAKRNRELGLDKMTEWRKEWKIKLWNDYNTWEPIFFKYKFILDTLENFHNLDLDNQYTNILLWSWKEDMEVPFFELRALYKRYKNINLRWYLKEWHSLSEGAVQKFVKDIDIFLKEIENTKK